MKNLIITFSTLFFILCAAPGIYGQINRTTETKIVDILSQLPTNDLNHSNKLMEEILGLGPDGISRFTTRLIPAGTGDDTQVRYAIHSLAVYAGGKKSNIQDNIVEKEFIKAIENTTDNEVRTFLISRLAFCGSNTSVSYLGKFLSDETLYKPALVSMSSIGTPEAGQSILEAAKNADAKIQPALIDALGKLNFEPGVDLLDKLTKSNSIIIRQKSLMALAEIAMERSETTILKAVQKANYNLDESKAILAYIRYGNRLNEKEMNSLSVRVGENLLKNCNSASQLNYRAAGIDLLSENMRPAFMKTFLKEAQNPDNIYREAVLVAASKNMRSEDVPKWVKAYKKASAAAKPQFIRMLSLRKEPLVYDECILPAVKNSNVEVRIAGVKALEFQDKAKSFPLILESLKQSSSSQEYDAIEETLLRICTSKDNQLLASSLTEMNDGGKAVIVNVLAARAATTQFEYITSLLSSSNDDLTTTVYSALSSISTSNDLTKLVELLNNTQNKQNIKNAQQAIVHVLDNSDSGQTELIIKAFDKSANKEKILPLLPALNSEESLQLVMEFFESGSEKEKIIAVETLSNWKNNDALPHLFQIVSTSESGKLRSTAFDSYLLQASKSTYPDDQKLLLVNKLMPFSSNNTEKREIINRAGNIKTFLSLVYVSKYLDNNELSNTAAYAAVRIALPSPGEKNNLSGDIVREIISKSGDVLRGPGSEYTKIDVNEFLSHMSSDKGFVSIFNGKDLTGWEGLVKNPIERGEMSKNALAKAQAEANDQMLKDWFIKDGIIGFKGEGYNNICTIQDYGDFEMIVDWKITNGGDSGIYLRGTPQVQIWDIARVDVGAQVGSGGLYNNEKNESDPLVVADNPINDWNTFRIKMVGERVTVHLNGVLVTNNVVLENYWDRKLPIFIKEAIELQAHGEDLGFRNIYVREINSGAELLSDEEISDGYKSLFNGKDLDHWIGNKKDYFVENNELVVRPKQGGHGNLYTAEEYSDFVFRFEFKLTPGANNGLGIHSPLEGDAAYVGKELQILDNTAAIYANLETYQYHGSVYGVMAAKRGFLKPVGEWNSEEVIVKGDQIKITLNGTVILDGNIKEASKNGTLDGKDHPGLAKRKGHIAFLGHGSELQFRNIRIKDISE